MALLDLLHALTSNSEPTTVDEVGVTTPRKTMPNAESLIPPTDSPQMQAPMGPVNAPPSGASQEPTPPGLNYNNTRQAGALNDAMSQLPPSRGGSANPGIYGILPQKLQHGNLRNVLGAIGDAFLVQGGAKASYGPRMANQEVGSALAGYDPNDPASVQAAIQRVAATGSPESQEMVAKLQASYAAAQSRKTQMEQTAEYHNGTLEAKRENLYNRMYATATGDLGRAKDAEDYARRLARWDQRIKAIDPEMDAVTALGVPSDFDPDQVSSTMGMTSNQTTQSSDRGLQRETSRRNTDVNAGARIQAAGISAGAHVEGANISANRPSSAQMLEGLVSKMNNGETLTPAEQSVFNRLTHVSQGRGRSSLPAGLTPGGSKPTAKPTSGGSYPTFTRAQALAASRVPGNKGKGFKLQGSDTIQYFH